MIQSRQESVAILNDTTRSTTEREKAIHALQDSQLEPEELEVLIRALSDDAVGVRWAAGAALAYRGPFVLPAVLLALAQPDSNTLLRASAHHVLHDNASAEVRKQAEDLLTALRGPASDVASMNEATKWLHQLNQF